MVENCAPLCYNKRKTDRGDDGVIRVLICDDDIAFAEVLRGRIRQVLQQRDKKAQIQVYAAAEEIPENTLERYDIAFLDIDFAGKNYTGIDIARRLRQKRQDAVILFVTNFPEYAPEGYEVQAFRYLLKSAVKEKLENYLSQALEKLENAGKMLTLNVYGSTVQVPIKDVLYIEAKLHEAELYLVDPAGDSVRTYRFYASIGNLEEELEEEGFLRIHKSYLANIRHILKLQCREAELTGGIKLRVSERTYAQLKQKYLLWKGE